jgi:RNA polymerase sigma-70 factor (ECF subfamily)
VTAASERGFAALVWRHQNALYRYGRGLGLDHDTALDLVQDAFVKAHARLDQCREPDKARSWLFRIFRNTMLDWARNVRRTEVPLPDVEEPAGEEDFAERHALREAIGAALASLTPTLREAFLLRHELGHSYEEIAELAGISLSAAKMRVARAHAALRETLEPDFGNVTGAGSRSS